jgi:hypothetical protein
VVEIERVANAGLATKPMLATANASEGAISKGEDHLPHAKTECTASRSAQPQIRMPYTVGELRDKTDELTRLVN